MMKLKGFRVTDFRSVADSDWIETEDVTALIGTNEAGKTNILLPLWKLNPAKGGDVVPTADYPRKKFTEFRQLKQKPDFVSALFEVDDAVAAELSAIAGVPPEMVREVQITRDLGGDYSIDFPNADPARSVATERVAGLLDEASRDLEQMGALKTEEDLKKLLLGSLQTARQVLVSAGHEINADGLASIATILDGAKTETAPKTSVIVPRFKQVPDAVRALQTEVSRPHPADVDAATDLAYERLPKFVYYSTYGNLDSEIYLPHVIANLKRTDLGIVAAAKARTLRVLFEFVGLQPEEILELGRDFKDPASPTRAPTEQEITAIADKKRERSILLQSASAVLTTRFREWWKQGEYRFRFEADGDHFRIWVSDDKRPEEIELEGRSTGLQWFLSFFLVFLVEREDQHESAILLLDEPGLSLHPLAQRDLSEFFDNLAHDNQLLYTCHSPFLVDADRLERARKVYVGADGTTKVSADLRAADGDVAQRGAAYAVHAAVGLSVAESLLLGCEPVVVEGPSDQHYLTAIKNLLIASGRLRPGRELVFPPAGGTKGVKAVSSILLGRDDKLPLALFDSDSAGLATAKALRQGLYVEQPDSILEVSNFTGIATSEVEDLIPPSVLNNQLDRWLRNAETPFADVYKAGQPVVPQIETWATDQKIELKVPGWKVELAKRVKQQLLKDGPSGVAGDILDRWEKLFAAFTRP